MNSNFNMFIFFFSSRRRHTSSTRDWSSDVCSSDLDGVAKTSATNVVSDGIPGLELTLRAPTSSAVTVNVGAPAPDKAQTIAAVKAFVSGYNDVVTKVRAELTERRVTSPQSTADAQKGDLFGDPMLASMLD